VQAIAVDVVHPGEALRDHVGRGKRVLIDAPCSGLGAIRRNPEARWRLQPGDVARFAASQAALLRAAAPLVAPGGRLIYCTCSFLTIEGESVVEEFLATDSIFTIVTARDVLGGTRAEHVATKDGRYLRTWRTGFASESDGMDGFFAAVLRRKKQVLS
jgi:16S rRNA (cytosine967-C5)-methyltransferase